MSNRKFIILFLAGIVFLVAVLAFLNYRASLTADESTRNTMCTFDPETIEGIEIDRLGTNVVKLTRSESNAWRMTSPYSLPADTASVMRLIDSVTTHHYGDMRSEGELAELGEDIVDFSLSGNCTAVIKFILNKTVVNVCFGALTASKNDVYARIDGLRNVFTLPADILNSIPNDADAFRRRTLSSQSPEGIMRLDLRAPESPFVRLTRDPSGWMMVSPLDVPADDAMVESMLVTLTGSRAVSFVLPSCDRTTVTDENGVIAQSALEPYGLTSESGLSVTVSGTSQERDAIVFGASAGTNLVYALIRNGTEVVTLDNKIAELFRNGDASFRDTRVFPLGSSDRVKKFSVTYGDVVYTLCANESGEWRIESPVSAAADPVVVSAWLDIILSIKRNDIPNNLSKDKALRVALSATSGTHHGVSVPAHLFFGCGPIANLRSKIMFEADAMAVRRLSVKSEGSPLVAVVYDEERNIWNLDPSCAPATVNTDAVKNLLTALARVEAAEVETVAAMPRDLQRCSLSDPAFVISVDSSTGGSNRRNLLIGGAAPNGGRYATLAGSDAIFILEKATAKMLMQPITE